MITATINEADPQILADDRPETVASADLVSNRTNSPIKDINPTLHLMTEPLAPVASAPLARTHLTQKHYYALDNYYTGAPVLPAESQPNLVPQTYIESKPASLAVEAAVAIVINGIHYAVLMASPSQLEYLAIGFLYSEGLIEHSYELLDWEIIPVTDISSLQKFAQDSTDDESSLLEALPEHLLDYDTYIIELTLSQRCHQRIQAQRRQLAGRTGCGMCGITGLTQALPNLGRYQQSLAQAKTVQPSLEYLLKIRNQIATTQHTHQLTGAVHAAAAMQGEQLYLFEDVGRHNALDKLIGWQLRNKTEVECVVMTSRMSIELIQKAIRMGLPWLAGMSAPTSTAVRVAQRYGLGLAGFLREDRVTYYSGL
nr:formate dehydrogenase accessory sulfurtransferase FdhD [Psychrobacter jeotgali]